MKILQSFGLALLCAWASLTFAQAQSNFTSLQPFESITLNQGFDVTLIVSDRYGISYDGGSEEDPSQLGIEQQGKGLMLNKLGQSTGPDMIYVYTPRISSIMILGSGNLYTEGTFRVPTLSVTISGLGDVELSVRADKVALMINGKGDIKLDGQAGIANMTLNGAGDIDAQSLYTQEAYVVTNGQGDVSISVDQKLVGTISGQGDIYYWGNPQVIRTVSGAGDVMQMGRGSRAE